MAFFVQLHQNDNPIMVNFDNINEFKTEEVMSNSLRTYATTAIYMNGGTRIEVDEPYDKIKNLLAYLIP